MNHQDAAQDTAHTEMLVEIRTRDDRAIGMTRSDDGRVALSVDAASAQPFRLVMMVPDLFALRTPDSLEWLSIEDDARLSLKAGEIGPQQTFQLVRGSDADTHFGFRFVAGDAFLARDGERASSLSATAPGLDTAERLTFVPVLPEHADVPDGHHACCCGPVHAHAHLHAGTSKRGEEHADVLWDEYTHFRIVEMAVHYLRHMENPTAEARFISELWYRGSRKIAEGLKGADEWGAWKPTHPAWAMFYFHFYNPETGTSFPWPSSWYPHNAVSKGTETFNTSVRLYREGELRHDDALVHLGLSLHFLTDLCQPMHAANFINNPLYGDWRHSGYETYAEDFTKNRNFFKQPGGYPPIRRDEIEDVGPRPDQWLIGVATQSFATWKEVLKPVVDRKVKFIPGPHGPIRIYDNTWHASEADPALMRSLWLAPRNTARYLCIWANRVLAG